MSLNDDKIVKLFDSVVKLDIKKEVTEEGTGRRTIAYTSGSGFYVSFRTADGNSIPAIVTNRHVLEGAIDINIKTKVETEKPIFEVDLPIITMENINPETIVYHDHLDLAALSMGYYIEMSRRNGINLKHSYIDEHVIFDPNKNLDIFNRVAVLGYPLGFAEKITNHPIVYQGTFAYPPSLKFEGDNEYLLNCDSVNGNSGSIVYALTHSGIFLPIGIQYSMLKHPDHNLTLTRVIKIEELANIKEKLLEKAEKSKEPD